MSAKKWTRRTASAVSAVLKLSSRLPKMMSCAGWFRPLIITVTKAAAYMATSLHDITEDVLRARRGGFLALDHRCFTHSCACALVAV